MANELENTFRNVAQKIAKYVEDAAELRVETRYVEIGDGQAVDFATARPVARTVIKLDGDSQAVVPMRLGEGNRPEVDTALFELHQKNVVAAVEYRARILNALLGAFPKRP